MIDGPSRYRAGVVVSYDAHRGDGFVAVEGSDVWFHCTQIADGTRHIEPGTPVTLDLVPGLMGRLEARAVRRSL